MTVRLPEELDARLETIARARHVSKHALLIEATDRFVQEAAKTDRVLTAVHEITTEYAGLITRLEDA